MGLEQGVGPHRPISESETCKSMALLSKGSGVIGMVVLVMYNVGPRKNISFHTLVRFSKNRPPGVLEEDLHTFQGNLHEKGNPNPMG
jgi:hypothetical protein